MSLGTKVVVVGGGPSGKTEARCVLLCDKNQELKL